MTMQKLMRNESYDCSKETNYYGGSNHKHGYHHPLDVFCQANRYRILVFRKLLVRIEGCHHGDTGIVKPAQYQASPIREQHQEINQGAIYHKQEPSWR